MRGCLIKICVVLAVMLGGCQTHLKQSLGAPEHPAAYAQSYPLYAELCAASQFRKRPGIGPPIEGGGFGGHSVLYLNGVCRVKHAGSPYPAIALCPPETAGQGVGLSINAHYKNANWVATEGRDFFFHGLVQPGETVTRGVYEDTIARAEALGILDGVEFHSEVFKDIPAGTSERDYKYQVSLGTDYALGYARDRYCARVPLTPSQMGRVVDYLNAVNEPYRTGRKDYRWNVLRDNCSHLIHNALAAAGVWRDWPTNRSLVVSALSFPVPKNEFVNLLRRTNDGPLADPEALFEDPIARRALMEEDWLATQPGALAELERMATRNDVYDPDVQLVFYSDPLLGPYERRFSRITAEPRYSNLKANLAYFAALYRRIRDERKPLSWHLDRRAGKSEAEREEFARFYARYYAYIERQSAIVARTLAPQAP